MNVKCQACGASFIAPDDKIRGRVLTYKCRRCGAAMRVDGMHLTVGGSREVEAEERESFLPSAPSFGMSGAAAFAPMGKAPSEDVESGWSEPSDVAEKAAIPSPGTFKAPGVPKDLTPPTPAAAPAWETSVGEGERPTIAGSAADLAAAMMEHEEPGAPDSAAPTARKPELEAALLNHDKAVTPATPMAIPAAAKPAAGTKAPSPGAKPAAAPVVAKAPPAAATPKVAPQAAIGAKDVTPTPLATKTAAVDLTPTPLMARPAPAKMETPVRAPAAKKLPAAMSTTQTSAGNTSAAAITPPTPAVAPAKPGGPLLAATSPVDDDPPFLLAPGPKPKAAPAPGPMEDSGLFDLRAIMGDAAPTGPAAPAVAKPPPAVKPPPPKPGAAPHKPPPPKPNRPHPKAEEVDASLELDVDLGDDAETVPVPVERTADAAPSPIAPVVAVAADTAPAAEDAPPSSDLPPVSLSEVEDAPVSSTDLAPVSSSELSDAPAAEAALQGDGDIVVSSEKAADLPEAAKTKDETVARPKPPTPASKSSDADDDPFAPLAAAAKPSAAIAPLDLSVPSTKATTVPPAARVSRPPTPEELGKGGSKAPIIVGLLLLLVGGAIFFATRGGDAPADGTTAARTGEPPKGEPTKTDGAVAQADLAAKTAAPTPTTEPTKDSPTAAKTGDPPQTGDVAKPSGDSGKTASADTPKPTGDTAKAAPAETAKAEPVKPSGDTPKAAPAETTKPEPAKPAETTATPIKPLPPASGSDPIDKGAVASAMGAAASAAAACKPADGTGGVARVSVTFATSGRATQALVNGPPFAGTPTGGCIASKFRSASVPPFSGDPVTVHKTVSF